MARQTPVSPPNWRRVLGRGSAWGLLLVPVELVAVWLLPDPARTEITTAGLFAPLIVIPVLAVMSYAFWNRPAWITDRPGHRGLVGGYRDAVRRRRVSKAFFEPYLAPVLLRCAGFLLPLIPASVVIGLTLSRQAASH